MAVTRELDPEILEWDALIERYEGATDFHSREQVALALFWKARKLWERGAREDALPVWEELVRRFGDATEPEIRKVAGWGVLEKGATLVELRRTREAHGVFSQAAADWAPRRGSRIRNLIAAALVGAVWLVVVLRLQGPLGRVVFRLERRLDTELDQT